MEVTSPDSEWNSPSFRLKVVTQIEEAMRCSGTAHTKSSTDLENHVFMKAKNREEYLSLVARLIIHYRDIGKKKQAVSVMEVTSPASEWNSPSFRLKVVAQIEEAMRRSGTAHIKSSTDLENQVFIKSKTREEYLSLVARVIIHFRAIYKMSQDTMNALQSTPGAGGVGPGVIGIGPRPPGAQMGGMGPMQMGQHAMQGCQQAAGAAGQMPMMQQQQSIQFQQFQSQQQAAMQLNAMQFQQIRQHHQNQQMQQAQIQQQQQYQVHAQAQAEAEAEAQAQLIREFMHLNFE